MQKFWIRAVVTVVVMTLPALPAGLCAETWRLDGQGQWQKPEAGQGNRNEEYLLRVTQMKKLVDAGRPNEVRKASKQLKADFPEIAGADFNTFTEAEVLLARGKLTKAVKEYDKLLDDYPSSGLRDAALEREYQIGAEFLGGRKKPMLMLFRISAFDDGVKIMEKISDRTGSAEIAIRASLTLAESFENRHKYNEAYLKWSEISRKWPTGKTGEDSLLSMARNKYETFRGPDYDGSGLISAKSYYGNFKLRYSEKAQELKVDEILSRIDEQLAQKNLNIAKYYQKTGSVEPANMYYQRVVDNWPKTKAAQEAGEKISKK